MPAITASAFVHYGRRPGVGNCRHRRCLVGEGEVMKEPGIITAIPARAVLAGLRDRGFIVVVRDGKIGVTPGPEPLTDADRLAIRINKDGMLAALGAP